VTAGQLAISETIWDWRRQRKALDLTQQALADKAGYSVATLKKIEADERRPSREMAERLADFLAIPQINVSDLSNRRVVCDQWIPCQLPASQRRCPNRALICPECGVDVV
jgi:transcriptional regulator with XRE-family HTH domain